tara:strand:+ start:66 stop:443 length:378 start_codon:yes stop_codon:yes gene_type:complete
MKLTNTQTEILNKESLVKEHRGETLSTVSIYGSAQHRSLRALEDKGFVSLAFLQPSLSTFVFATRKGQAEGIGLKLSLSYEERTEKEVTLSKNDRYFLREALEGYTPSVGFDWDDRLKKLTALLA